MYKLFFALRYLRKRRIAYFAVAAVTLCTAMVLIVMSVMGGWLEQVKQRARGLLGDVIVDNRAYPGFPLYQEFIERISAWPQIVRATPVIYSYGLIRFKDTEQSGTVRIVGLRLDEVYEVNAFKASLYYERLYPRTTSLGDQRQPLIGVDLNGESMHFDNGRTLPPFVLPPPLQEALAAARRQHHERHGEPLDDRDSVDTDINELLRRNRRPIIPGHYAFNEDGGLPVFAGDPRPGLILGRDIVARRLSDGRYERFYPRGSIVTLTLWATSARGSVDPIPIKQPFRYADDSRTGIFEIDSQHVYCDFDLLQKLLQMDAAERVDEAGNTVGTVPARCSQIQIKIAPGVDPAALCTRLTEVYKRFLNDPQYSLDSTERRLIERIEAMTWEQSQIHIIAPVEKEKVLVTILFGVISLVAVALVLCILYMIVLQKTRDIGVIKSIGGSSRGVAFIFVFYGAAVGVAGSLLGTLLGTVFVSYINEFQDFLISVHPSLRVWDLQVYSFDRIPSRVDPSDATLVVLIGVVASTLGSLAAAWRAGSMQPVEALRYE